MNEKEMMHELQLCIPEFGYDNGIAYEICMSVETITFTFTDTQELSIYSIGQCELTTKFVDWVMDIMESKLDDEVSNNKLNWCYNYLYNGE